MVWSQNSRHSRTLQRPGHRGDGCAQVNRPGSPARGVHSLLGQKAITCPHGPSAEPGGTSPPPASFHRLPHPCLKHTRICIPAALLDHRPKVPLTSGCQTSQTREHFPLFWFPASTVIRNSCFGKVTLLARLLPPPGFCVSPAPLLSLSTSFLLSLVSLSLG